MAHIAGETRCRYRYDALDRMVSSEPGGQATLWRFYQRDRLSTQIQGPTRHSLLHADEHLLAFQRKHDEGSDCELLATDQQSSVIATPQSVISYTPYGHRRPLAAPLNLPGFTGQQVDPITGHYLLGNGYRAFNPSLMRLNSPDNLSPFGDGGLNAYAYCVGDPVNWIDIEGHAPAFLRWLLRIPRPFKGSSFTTSSKMKNFKILGEEAYTFEDSVHGQSRLNISAHGHRASADAPSKLVVNQKKWSAQQVNDALTKKGYDLPSYDRIRLISCYSASGKTSFADDLAQITGRSVTGFTADVADNRSFNRVGMVVEEFRKRYPNTFEKKISQYYSHRKHMILRPQNASEIIEFSPRR
ncbi:RHS repeat-associated core domain-containing protein [Pseudomonas viridiflava]|uniref:RHS repeat-associated core domain-containing protein n=1 Tax=Pseudomonas viridiflava TaxID=33069 RepID=UPI002EAB751B|nr:RHS repeat-associated core domain-containing protein [Pseudomonas viridiflava]